MYIFSESTVSSVCCALRILCLNVSKPNVARVPGEPTGKQHSGLWVTPVLLTHLFMSQFLISAASATRQNIQTGCDCDKENENYIVLVPLCTSREDSVEPQKCLTKLSLSADEIYTEWMQSRNLNLPQENKLAYFFMHLSVFLIYRSLYLCHFLSLFPGR